MTCNPDDGLRLMNELATQSFWFAVLVLFATFLFLMLIFAIVILNHPRSY